MPPLQEDYDVFFIAVRFPIGSVPVSFSCVELYIYTLGILDIRQISKEGGCFMIGPSAPNPHFIGY
jgi:hypothetical protein